MGAEINPVDVFGWTTAEGRVARLPGWLEGTPATLENLLDFGERIAGLFAASEEENATRSRQTRRQAETIILFGGRIREARRRFDILRGLFGWEFATVCEAEIDAVRAHLVERLHDDEKPRLGE